MTVEGVVPAGTDTATATPTPVGTTPGDDSFGFAPGFGPGAALVALALLAGGRIARRRR